MLKPNQKVAIYMEGFIHSDYGKMGLGVARYLQNHIVGIIDSKYAGSNINKEHPIERNIPIYEKLDEVISRVDVFSLNDEEARQITGSHSLVEAAKKLQTMGPTYIIIKKGEHGALLFNEEKIFYAPALPLEDVFDPTGAGDSFIGGFAGYLSQSGRITFEEMKTATIMGSAMASFTVEKFGIERLISLDKSQIESRINEFKSLVSFT